MTRGTFANTRLINKMCEKDGPKTIYVPTKEVGINFIYTYLFFEQKAFIFDAAERYQKEGHQLIILAGNEYGSGSSRDWAAKGPYLQVIKIYK